MADRDDDREGIRWMSYGELAAAFGTGNSDALIRRAEKLADGHPMISSLVAKLADVRRRVVRQVAAIDREIRRLVRREPTLKRLMTVPGVGPITAVAFLFAVDDVDRFKHARDVFAPPKVENEPA